MWLTLEAIPGQDIRDAIDKSIKIAKQLDVTVWFEFNGVEIGIRPDTDANLKYREWLRVMASDRQYKII